MPEYDNSMRGVLFRNEKRESDNHPDYKGNGEVNGVEVWISAWVKRAKKDNKPYMSLSFENKEGQVVASRDVPIDTADLPSQAAAVAEDDIPF